ncbi:hypothetical protein FQZ97_908240 [compost metagenome]
MHVRWCAFQDLQFYQRQLLPHAGKDWRRQQATSALGQCNADFAGRCLYKRRQVALHVVHFFHNSLCACQESMSGLRERNTARMAFQQCCSHAMLKPLNPFAQRRLRNAEIGRCLGKTPVLSHGDEGTEVFKNHGQACQYMLEGADTVNGLRSDRDTDSSVR